MAKIFALCYLIFVLAHRVRCKLHIEHSGDPSYHRHRVKRTGSHAETMSAAEHLLLEQQELQRQEKQQQQQQQQQQSVSIGPSSSSSSSSSSAGAGGAYVGGTGEPTHMEGEGDSRTQRDEVSEYSGHEYVKNYQVRTPQHSLLLLVFVLVLVLLLLLLLLPFSLFLSTSSSSSSSSSSSFSSSSFVVLFSFSYLLLVCPLIQIYFECIFFVVNQRCHFWIR